jgi:hypothetical protein
MIITILVYIRYTLSELDLYIMTLGELSLKGIPIILFVWHPRGPLPILLGTDVRPSFLKHTHPYIQYFWKPYLFIYFRRKSWPNHLFLNNIATCLYIQCTHCSCCLCKVRGWFTTHWYNGKLNYLLIDITDWWNCNPLIYFTGQKDYPIQRYVCVYQNIGRPPPRCVMWLKSA